LIAAVSLPVTAIAQDDSETIIQYSIEFVCGTNSSGYESVVPGDYTMVANVHNANTGPNQARSKVSLSYPVQAMSDVLTTEFAAQQSRQLNCGDILDQFAFVQPIGDLPLLEGFLLIQAPKPLEVVARYTATGEMGEVSVDVERVPGRLLDSPVEEPDEEKVKICHLPPGNPDNAQEIEVGASAVASHLEHGDYLGECADPVAQPLPEPESGTSSKKRPRR
jgi:hypothetical protein